MNKYIPSCMAVSAYRMQPQLPITAANEQQCGVRQPAALLVPCLLWGPRGRELWWREAPGSWFIVLATSCRPLVSLVPVEHCGWRQLQSTCLFSSWVFWRLNLLCTFCNPWEERKQIHQAKETHFRKKTGFKVMFKWRKSYYWGALCLTYFCDLIFITYTVPEPGQDKGLVKASLSSQVHLRRHYLFL